MESLRQDLRYAVRTLLRRPGFTIIAVLTIMLGIGANTAIFSVVSAVLLRPLPYPDADRLTLLFGTAPGQPRTLVSITDIAEWRSRSRAFEDIGLERSQSVNLTGTEQPDRLVGAFISANMVRILGARVAMGRAFTDDETALGTGKQVALISHEVWVSRFGSDSSLLGRSLTLNGRPHTVIGILAPGFREPYGAVEVWLPITSAPNPNWFTRGQANVWGFGKLKPGVTKQQAEQDLARVTAALAREYPATNAGVGASVIPLREQIVGDVRPSLLMVLAFVGVVLLIACANVANLMLARAAARSREMSLRAALGAARGRLVRQLLTESLLLSAAGGLLGVLLAQRTIAVLVANVPGGLPAYGPIGLDLRVLGFSALITIVAGLLFGAAPALRASRVDLHESLQVRAPEGGRGGRADLRNMIVAFELALCIVLLAGAGLLTRSLAMRLKVDPGFRPEGLLTAEFRLPQVKYTNDTLINDFMARALAQLRAIPGASSAALIGAVPLSGNFGMTGYVSDAHPDTPVEQAPQAQQNGGSDGMFRTLGMRVLAGRDFASTDRYGGEMVAIVNDVLAAKEWPGQSAIGHRLKILGPPDTWVTVVGVVNSVKQLTMTDVAQAQVWQPQAQVPGIFSSVLVRTEGDPDALANALRAAIWAVDPDQPVWKVRSLSSLVERDVAPPKFTMLLTGAFALLALVLAAVGVYGVMSYAVIQRTRELGIRVALGAKRREVVGLVLGRGARVIGAATVIGLVGAFFAAKLMRGQLYGIQPTDPVTFIAVPVVLAAVALLACYLPARRAARVDPVIALRSD